VSVVLLAGSALALAVAPVLMPTSYSWIVHTTSESAAQGIEGAWLARLGFLLFGFGVLVLVWAHPAWSPRARASHTAFGVLMVSAAAFSTRRWQPGASYDKVEDALHSVVASGLGVAFALGVLAVVMSQRPAIRLLGPLAVAASIVLPLGMSLWDGAAGVLQRTMFAVAYTWYAVAALHLPSEDRPLAAGERQDGDARR
jgi:hypothetical protein